MLERIFDYLQYNLSIEAGIVLLILIFLEAILSADNAIALAAIAQGLEDKNLERQALNIGLVVAYVLRITLLLTATWVQQYWQFELIGAAYLLWLVFQHFASSEEEEGSEHTARYASLWQVIPVIAFTDLDCISFKRAIVKIFATNTPTATATIKSTNTVSNTTP